MRRALCLVGLVWIGCRASSESEREAETEKPAAREREADGDPKGEPEAHEPLPSRIRLTDKVKADAGIKVAPAANVALPLTVALNGELISDPDRTAKVAARVAGRIAAISVKEGDRVKAGALLAVIESPELARGRAALTTARARALAAHQNLERLQRVAEKGLASGQEVAAAQADTATLDAEQRAARQTLAAVGADADEGDGARLELRAEVGGFVLARDAVRGQTVAPEQVVFVVADLDKAYFNARLFEKDIARVKVGAAAAVRLNAYPNEVFQGRVEAVGRALDPAARTVLARIAIQNRNDLLKVGLFGSAGVVVPDAGFRTPRPVVPLTAVTEIAGHACLFVQQQGGDFEVHRVTLGRSAGDRIEIVAGLRAGELVAIDGVFTLKSAVLKSTFGEED